MVEEKEDALLMPSVSVDLRQLARVNQLGAGRYQVRPLRPNAVMSSQGLHNNNKELRYRRGTARRSESVDILSTAAQLYKNHN